MSRAFRAAVALFMLGLLSIAPAAADKRVALVIGNSAYQNTAPLTNPGNDAADMSAALRKLGFIVVEGRDLDKLGMDRTVRQFARELGGADVGLVCE